MSTIEFLPERLNREPTVFRGLTTSELFLALAVGLIAGALAAAPFAIGLAQWALVPTGALLTAFCTILFGGRYLARLKRGRPDTWLYRQLDAWCARHGIGRARLVQSSGVWALRRSLK